MPEGSEVLSERCYNLQKGQDWGHRGTDIEMYGGTDCLTIPQDIVSYKGRSAKSFVRLRLPNDRIYYATPTVRDKNHQDLGQAERQSV